jgi:hypothetical protein
MKKYILFLLAICFISLNPVRAQLGGLLKKATKSVTNASNELLGNPSGSSDNVNSEPEPSCASDQAELAFDLGGKLHLMYTEVNLKVNDDGSLLVQDTRGGNYYIANNGVTQGPYKENDSRVAAFNMPKDDSQGKDDILTKYKQYITKSGDKYLITFDGKSYGPYAVINSFVVSKTKTKFAALVVPTVLTTDDEAKKMEAAMKNAKTQQEQIELAQKYAQLMQERMIAGGGMESNTTQLVSNIPDSHYDLINTGAGSLTADIKYDDILVNANDKIVDLHGNTLFSLTGDLYGASDMFINSDNTKLATYRYGTLTFNDKKTLSGMSNPHLVKVNGQVYLSYLYYSPKRNAIMQNKIPF